MKRIITVCLSIMLIAALLCACGGSKSYKNGTYTGQSQIFKGDEEGNGDGYGVVTLTIKDNAITACEFQTYEPDGTLKDDEYGKVDGEIKNEDYYHKAQQAIKGSAKYAEMLVTAGNPNTFENDIDAISGATFLLRSKAFHIPSWTRSVPLR